MHMCSYIALVAQVSPCVSFHVIHACALVFGCLSVLSLHPSLYFFLQFLFQLFLMSTLVPDENSMKDPLCNSSFGSMVSLDYVTPDTVTEDVIEIPTASFAEKIVEVHDTQTQAKMQQGANSNIQHVVDSIDAEDRTILGKINQVTKHVGIPSLETVERTVENAQLHIIEKLSETLAISSDILASSG